MDIDTGDALLRCEVHGAAGPLVICAHGFPDCERSFRHQLDDLLGAGYRVATPTMRGYAPSSPSRRGKYHMEAVGQDLIAIAEKLSPNAPARLFGHDWGALAAYAATSMAPGRFSHVVTAAVPHPRVAGPRFAHPAQARRSWYMGLFQLPIIAERKLRANDMELVDRLWRDWSPGYRCPDNELRCIKRAIDPDVGAVLAYYRALKSPEALFGDARRWLLSKTRIPAMYLHGVDDGCIGVELCNGVEAAYDAGVEVHVIEGAGHFVHLEQPGVVNPLLLRFFGS